MFDFDDLEEQEITAAPATAAPATEEAPPAEQVTVETSKAQAALSSPPKEDPPPPPFVPALAETAEPPPPPPLEEALSDVVMVPPEPRSPRTPEAAPSSQLRRPPGLASPPRTEVTSEVTGHFVQLSPFHRDHILRPEELRRARGAAPPMEESVVAAANAQFTCLMDASGEDLDVVVAAGSRSKIFYGSRVVSCALKPEDRHLLVALEDATVSMQRLDPSGIASTVLRLQFALEDPPKEVAWHPTNQKVFLTLHASRVRLWNLQLLTFQTMGQAKMGVMVTPELLDASCGEANAPDPKESLQRMSVSPSGQYVCAISEKRFCRWSVREDEAIPIPFNLEIFDLEGVDGSQELRLLRESHALMLGEREVTVCALPLDATSRLTVLQRLQFHSCIRCERQTGNFLAIYTASEHDGEVDLLLRSTLEPLEGFCLRCFVASRLGQDALLAPPLPAGLMELLDEPEAGYPPGLPMPSPALATLATAPSSRPPGLPSPPFSRAQEPPGLTASVQFDVPPGLALDAPQVDLGYEPTSQPSQPSQSSARSFEKDVLEAPQRTVESSDDLSGADAKQPAPAGSSTSMVQELSSFMQKRADRASDAVVDQVIQVLPNGGSGEPARKIMHECRQIEEQAHRAQRQVLKVLERPRPASRPADLASAKDRCCTEVVQKATANPHFPSELGQHLAQEPRAEVIRQHLRPSKEKMTEVLQEDWQSWCSLPTSADVKHSVGKLPARQALQSFMAEVSSQSMQEMKRLLAEVQGESLQTSVTDACRRSVRATLRREVQALEAEVKSQSKQVTAGGVKDALMKRLGQKAMPLHTELDQIDKELRAAGEVLANGRRPRGQLIHQ